MLGGSWIGVTAVDFSHQLQEVGTINDVPDGSVAQGFNGHFDFDVEGKGTSHRHSIFVGV
jgi:hypothetical protein